MGLILIYQSAAGKNKCGISLISMIINALCILLQLEQNKPLPIDGA